MTLHQTTPRDFTTICFTNSTSQHCCHTNQRRTYIYINIYVYVGKCLIANALYCSHSPSLTRSLTHSITHPHTVIHTLTQSTHTYTHAHTQAHTQYHTQPFLYGMRDIAVGETHTSRRIAWTVSIKRYSRSADGRSIR